jgi:hypothetical protein
LTCLLPALILNAAEEIMNSFSYFLTVSVLVLAFGIAAGEHGNELTEDSYADAGSQLGVIIFEINWGRKWNCGPFENAQLQRLTFTNRSDHSNLFDGTELSLETPSKLFVDDEYTPMAIMVEPGTYALTGFDVKTARSMSDIGHFLGTEKELLPDGLPRGGTYSIAPGEIIYIGHFGLDCGDDVIPWRYYLTERQGFESFVAGFREVYPFTASTDVEFRLFETEAIGSSYSLDEPIVHGISHDDN